MATLKLCVVFLACFVSMAMSVPYPGFSGGGRHEHHIVHVPYNIHTVHHHHVKKIPIPIVKHVPVIKEVPIVKEIIKEVPIVKEVHVPVHIPVHVHKGWSHGWY